MNHGYVYKTEARKDMKGVSNHKQTWKVSNINGTKKSIQKPKMKKIPQFSQSDQLITKICNKVEGYLWLEAGIHFLDLDNSISTSCTPWR